MKRLLTPKQVAKAIGVSESSLKRWCDKGLLPTVRTAGGHRRLPASGVLGFLRATGQPLAYPQLLDLPESIGKASNGDGQVSDLLQALLCGDETRCRQIVFDLYLDGWPMLRICDELLAPAMRDLGRHWECGKAEVFEEHRASEIAQRLLFELRAALPAPSPSAPLAIGGTLAGDPYRLPTAMVELVLREALWQAQSHGTSLPVATMCAAVKKLRPRLIWVSVSAVESPSQFLADYALLWQAATAYGAAVIAGGAGLSPELRQRMQYSAFCDNLGHLVSFVTTLQTTAAPQVGTAQAG